MTRILTIIALMFATPAWAKTKAINCTGFILKYETGYFGDSCAVRIDGRWIDQDFEASDWSCSNSRITVDFIENTLFSKSMEMFDPCEEVNLPN